MTQSGFNFEHVQWLWALALVPLISLLWTYRSSKIGKWVGLERFADKHLLPFLLQNSRRVTSSSRKMIAVWSTLWGLAVLALAGPRWDFREVPSYKMNKNLVILLDLSDSMNATDIQPSRLIRAREKIEDILNENPDVNIGLIGFAADAHVITPITEDKNAIRYVSGALQTDIVAVQGSRLSPALNLAGQLLSAANGKDKAILILSDGGFEDPSATALAKDLAAKNIRVSAVGFGTLQGAPVPTSKGGFAKNDNGPVISKLQQGLLEQITASGNGRYFTAQEDVRGNQLFKEVLNDNGPQASGRITKDWEPRYYIFLIPLLLFMIPLFRSASRASRTMTNILPLVLLLFIAAPQAKAGVNSLFKNSEIAGKEALEHQDYETAAKSFQDPYRRGVAQFRAGKLQDAEKSFRQAQRPEVALSAKYNLGNTLAEEGKYQQAIDAYNEVLKTKPQDQPTKDNLKIVQDLLKKQQQQQQQQSQQSSSQSKSQSESQSQSKSQAQSQPQQGQSQQQSSGQQNSSPQKDAQKNQNQNQNQTENHQAEQKSENAQNKKDNRVAGNQQQQEGKAQSKEEQQNQQQQELGQQKKPEQSQEKEQGQEGSKPESSVQARYGVDQQKEAKRSQKDIDADQWLNRISNDPHSFLKNQFMIESSRAQTRNGDQPW